MSFHVPERFRDEDHPVLRSTALDGNNGCFRLDSPSQPGWRLAVIASDGTDDPALSAQFGLWEHVSVHAYRGLHGRHVSRIPTWGEMCDVKDLFWDGEDVVVQYHPRRSEYVNYHPHVLHLWRPVGTVLPTPPSIYVGPDPWKGGRS